MLPTLLRSHLMAAVERGGVVVASDADPAELTHLERLCALGLFQFAEADGPLGGRLYAYRLTELGRAFETGTKPSPDVELAVCANGSPKEEAI